MAVECLAQSSGSYVKPFPSRQYCNTDGPQLCYGDPQLVEMHFTFRIFTFRWTSDSQCSAVSQSWALAVKSELSGITMRVNNMLPLSVFYLNRKGDFFCLCLCLWIQGFNTLNELPHAS